MSPTASSCMVFDGKRTGLFTYKKLYLSFVICFSWT